ncbi:hypothetical protein MASR2M8_20620 [Opitutaceae bacterium]
MSALIINGISWAVLVLIAGGLALGLERTGLDLRLTDLLPGGGGAYLLFAPLILLTLGLGTLLSNTAVANLPLPIGLAAASASGTSQIAMAVGIVMASLCVALLISTPPNAIACTQGSFSISEMACVGLTLGLAAPSSS